MNRIIFASDLDNTLMFSTKHKMEDDVCIEILDGKEQGFCRKESFALLDQIAQDVLLIPITTRSIEQYHRISLPLSHAPQYALTTNGAILLVNGKIDMPWYEQSKKIVEPWKAEFLEIQHRLQEISEIKRFRMIDDMYLFAACDNPKDAEISQSYFYDKTDLNVEVSGRKLYFFPPMLSKGDAIDRLREKFSPSCIISAGDSHIDIPMLNQADVSIFIEEYVAPQAKMICYQGNNVRDYTKFVLQQVLEEITLQKNSLQKE